jgi:GntR family transcriptional repressor for pyruvate dehydrogenase complex
MSNFEPLGRQTRSTQVAQELRRAIDGGHYQVEERLPSERVMCVQLGVSRVVLREALRELVNAGYIDVRHGSGTYVRSRAEMQDQALAQWLSSHHNHVVNLLEMRSLLEPGIAELAAQRAELSGIQALQQTIDLMRESNELEEIIRADEMFHSILAKLTCNSVVVQLIDHTMQAMGGEREVTLASPEGVIVAADGHQKVLDAIRAGDAVAASEAMHHHLKDARSYALRESAADPNRRDPESQFSPT